MSIEALRWAYGQSHGLNSTSKFVLTTLADYANEDNCAYPSKETLSAKTLLNRKTVIISLQRLTYHGFIHDTGNRKGRTGQVIVYQLNLKRVPNLEGLKSPENGQLKVCKGPSKGPEIGTGKGSRNRDIEPPEENHGTKKQSLSEIFEALRKDPRFDRLDVDGELELAVTWCRKKNRAVSAAFLERWLLRVEQPLDEDDDEPVAWWHDWTEERMRALQELYPNATMPPLQWSNIPCDVQHEIDARVKKGWPA